MPCVDLSTLPSSEVAAFVSSFDTVLSDCDGVLWHGNVAVEGAVEAVAVLRSNAKRIFFCSNNSTKARTDYVEKCNHLGLGGSMNDMVGTSYLTAVYLQDLGYTGTVYTVGSEGLTKELDAVGIKHVGVGPDIMPTNWTLDASAYASALDDDVKCVVVGFDPHFSYAKMAKAATVANRKDAIFIATNTDEQFPAANGVIIPGTGAIVSAVATAAGRKPVIMGKPSPVMFEEVQKHNPGITTERTIMIGDRANTDILFGKRCGLRTLMVGTGINSLSDVRAWEASDDPELKAVVPDFYIDSIGHLPRLLKQ